jgi:lysine 2,3-aminomutase
MKDLLFLTKSELADCLWCEDPHIKTILSESANLHDARTELFAYLNDLERHYFNIYSDRHYKELHICERANAKECIRVLKNVIRTENEKIARFSALEKLYYIAKKKKNALSKVDEGFLCEFIFLVRGAHGKSGVAKDVFTLPRNSRKASLMRSKKLDEYSERTNSYFKRYKSGTDYDLIEKRRRLKEKILRHFNGAEADWEDYRWHLKHIVRDSRTLSSLVKLDDNELEGLTCAEENNIPFHITPYYLSLFNEGGRSSDDRTIRAQVLPSKNYCLNVLENRRKRKDLDFMGEKSTSPIDGITRRYPQILILKAIDTCPQICVYCQRNWEVRPIGEGRATGEKTEKAIAWIRNNEHISEVLVTGGDPLLFDDTYINHLLDKLSNIEHIERIRIGTRILVTLPFRITEGLVRILKRYHELGRRDVCVVTHFEHSTEITPEAIEAIGKIRAAGISVYNQQVFTYFNSLRYETCALRRHLKLAGVDPYYTFNTKGKEETVDFRVPIARIEQERKEEARFLPGIVRTDEPIFNVPRIGKSYLRAWQDHEVIMILPSGQRVYRFYPWESKVTMVDDYIYNDVSIYDYLKRLADDGEDVDDYRSIWYYF